MDNWIVDLHCNTWTYTTGLVCGLFALQGYYYNNMVCMLLGWLCMFGVWCIMCLHGITVNNHLPMLVLITIYSNLCSMCIFTALLIHSML